MISNERQSMKIVVFRFSVSSLPFIKFYCELYKLSSYLYLVIFFITVCHLLCSWWTERDAIAQKGVLQIWGLSPKQLDAE